MKPFSTFLPLSARMLMLSSVFWIGACRENSRQVDTVATEAKPTVTQEEKLPDERITALQSEIQAGRQKIENIEAFVQMERAKLEDNPDYSRSFLEKALGEQQEIRETVESGERRLLEFLPGRE